VLSNVVDTLGHAGARVSEARPCSLQEAERLAQRLIQAVFGGAYPAEEYEPLRVLAETASVDDDSPSVRHVRDVTVRSRDLSIASSGSESGGGLLRHHRPSTRST
jgi:hypothetical protein